MQGSRTSTSIDTGIQVSTHSLVFPDDQLEKKDEWDNFSHFGLEYTGRYCSFCKGRGLVCLIIKENYFCLLVVGTLGYEKILIC
jgi:hypothetical protein